MIVNTNYVTIPTPRTRGMGAWTNDGSGLFGTGIFGSDVSLFDYSTWGAAEKVTIALFAYVLYSVVTTTTTKARAVAEGGRKIRRKATRIREAFAK